MPESIKTAFFGGGCFWCTEAVFKMIKGVISVEPGYAGGIKENPTYEEVSTGSTGYIEVTKIEYDPEKISFRDLLAVFFSSHDPTSMDRQGNDAGHQYRSVIFYTTDDQKIEAEAAIIDINNSSKEGRPIVTEIRSIDRFHAAEDYHKDYYEKHREVPYCTLIIDPKLDKIRKRFRELIKS
ncbi:MAG: peptide-methionine (S)-S-oxide reductase MsrA [Candidatus Colwellbacteria bacterium]|nr:peptide-methionine (S)-S-oxide reductase MsrA [Candidatus Colwellbacteria bacterium]